MMSRWASIASVAVGFDEGRPAPAHFTLRIGRDRVAARPVVAHMREVSGKVWTRVLETVKPKVLIGPIELDQRVCDEILVTQLEEPLRRDFGSGFGKIAIQLVEGRQNVV